MITVEMSDDIRKYENKTVGPFTTRQIVGIALGSVVALPIVMIVPLQDISNKILLFAVILIPFLACGFSRSSGGPIEVVAIRILYFYFFTPRKRKIIQKNEFYEEIKQRQEEKKNIWYSKLSPSEKKKYDDQYGGIGKKRKVKYSARKDMKVYR